MKGAWKDSFIYSNKSYTLQSVAVTGYVISEGNMFVSLLQINIIYSDVNKFQKIITVL